LSQVLLWGRCSIDWRRQQADWAVITDQRPWGTSFFDNFFIYFWEVHWIRRCYNVLLVLVTRRSWSRLFCCVKIDIWSSMTARIRSRWWESHYLLKYSVKKSKKTGRKWENGEKMGSATHWLRGPRRKGPERGCRTQFLIFTWKQLNKHKKSMQSSWLNKILWLLNDYSVKNSKKKGEKWENGEKMGSATRWLRSPRRKGPERGCRTQFLVFTWKQLNKHKKSMQLSWLKKILWLLNDYSVKNSKKREKNEKMEKKWVPTITRR